MSVPVRQFQAASGVPLFFPINAPSAQGPAGPATPGPTGPQGPAATSGTGTTGPTGPFGPQGFPGPTGPQGAASRTGPTGPTGLAGFAGPAGSGTGATGPAGATGPVGNTVSASRLNQLGPLTVQSGNQPSLPSAMSQNEPYQVGYFVARCITNPAKSMIMKIYAQNTANPGTNTDITTIVGNNINTYDVQQTTMNWIDTSTNYATLELINIGQSGPGPYQGVQLKSFFTGGGTESWVLSCAPNMFQGIPF